MIEPRKEGATKLPTILALLLLLTVLFGETATVMAAVGGDFSSEYDGYDDSMTTNTLGHEIAVRGTIRVSGTRALNPTITITGGKWTVLETGSVETVVEGVEPGRITKRFGPSRVRLSAAEIPPGTSIRLEFVVYFIGGTAKQNITSANIRVDYSTPSGERERKLFIEYTSVENSPDQRLHDLKGEQKPGSLTSIGMLVLSSIGGIVVMGGLLYLFFSIFKNNSQSPPKPPGGRG